MNETKKQEMKERLKEFVDLDEYVGNIHRDTTWKEMFNFIESEITQALAEQREEFEREKIASNIALLTLLVRNGSKGDMEKLISEFTSKLESITSLKSEE